MHESYLSISGTICNVCNQTFKYTKSLKKHVRTLHSLGDFKCDRDHCSYTTNLRGDLEKHVKKIHPTMKQCPVDQCGLMVKDSGLKWHLNKHYNIRNYPCSWPDCGKMFSDSKTLKDHLRIHLNVKSYRCKWPECGYASEQRTNVIKHIRIRHFKLPYTKKEELELNIQQDPNAPKPQDYVEKIPDNIRISGTNGVHLSEDTIVSRRY